MDARCVAGKTKGKLETGMCASENKAARPDPARDQINYNGHAPLWNQRMVGMTSMTIAIN